MEKGFFHPDLGYWQTIGTPGNYESNYPEGTIEVPLKPGTGFTWDGSEWVAPPPLTPEAIRSAMPPLTARQLRLGLISNGITLAMVRANIDAIADPLERETAQVEWDYATQFVRTHPLIVQIAADLSLTPEQVDTMWQAASSL